MTAQRLLCSFVCLAAATVDVHAFSPSPISMQVSRLSSPSALRSSTESSVADTTAEDTDDVTCYVVNDEEIITEGEKPHVVCTSEPDDYAWFNGVDPKSMREADGESESAEECVEGESYKGGAEWECE